LLCSYDAIPPRGLELADFVPKLGDTTEYRGYELVPQCIGCRQELALMTGQPWGSVVLGGEDHTNLLLEASNEEIYRLKGALGRAKFVHVAPPAR
jgi:hypothetical protein